MKTRFLLPFLFIGLFVSCDDSDDDPQSSNQNVSIQAGEINATDEAKVKMIMDGGTSRTWTAEAFTLGGQTNFTACRYDDQMVFNSDCTYNYDGGSDLCGAEDNQQFKTGTWEVDFNNLLIVFDNGTANEVSAEIIGLTENEVRLETSYMMMEVRGIYSSN